MAAGPLLRVLRAAVFTAVCVTLSAAGHAWMSGRAVAPWALVAASAGVFALAYALAGTRRRFPWIAALMLAGQTGLHALFSFAQGPVGAAGPGPLGVRWAESAAQALEHLGSPTATAMPMSAGMPMSGMSTAIATGASAGMPSGMGHGPWGMIAVHAAAGLLSAWWLARGEAVLFGLLWSFALSVLAPLRPAAGAFTAVTLPRRRPAASVLAPVRARCSVLLAHAVIRRGPPVRIAACL